MIKIRLSVSIAGSIGIPEIHIGSFMVGPLKGMEGFVLVLTTGTDDKGCQGFISVREMILLVPLKRTGPSTNDADRTCLIMLQRSFSQVCLVLSEFLI